MKKFRKKGSLLATTAVSIVSWLFLAYVAFVINTSPFHVISAIRSAHQAQQYADIIADTLRATSYSSLTSKAHGRQNIASEIPGVTDWQSQVTIGGETAIGSGTQRIATVTIYKPGDVLSRYSLQVPLSSLTDFIGKLKAEETARIAADNAEKSARQSADQNLINDYVARDKNLYNDYIARFNALPNQYVLNAYKNGKLSAGWDGSSLHYFFNGTEISTGGNIGVIDVTKRNDNNISAICPDSSSYMPESVRYTILKDGFIIGCGGYLCGDDGTGGATTEYQPLYLNGVLVANGGETIVLPVKAGDCFTTRKHHAQTVEYGAGYWSVHWYDSK